MLPEERRIKTKAQLNEWLAYELPRYGKGGIRKLFLISENSILRRHQVLLRKTEYYTNTQNRVMALLFKARLVRLQNRYSMHIPINCCGKGLYIVHIGPILMNGRVTVGENCSFHINTALVAGGSRDGVPTLADHVVVGIGAVVLGDVYIANHVAIGANAVVNKSILEENIAVAGVPATKISSNGSAEWNKGNKKIK